MSEPNIETMVDTAADFTPGQIHQDRLIPMSPV